MHYVTNNSFFFTLKWSAGSCCVCLQILTSAPWACTAVLRTHCVQTRWGRSSVSACKDLLVMDSLAQVGIINVSDLPFFLPETLPFSNEASCFPFSCFKQVNLARVNFHVDLHFNQTRDFRDIMAEFGSQIIGTATAAWLGYFVWKGTLGIAYFQLRRAVRLKFVWTLFISLQL